MSHTKQSQPETTISYTDNGLAGYTARMETTIGRISDIAEKLNAAFADALGGLDGLTTTEALAGHAYFFGTALGAAKAMVDFGDPESGSVMGMVKRGYDDIRAYQAKQAN